jgi:hypothetical protein
MTKKARFDTAGAISDLIGDYRVTSSPEIRKMLNMLLDRFSGTHLEVQWDEDETRLSNIKLTSLITLGSLLSTLPMEERPIIGVERITVYLPDGTAYADLRLVRTNHLNNAGEVLQNAVDSRRGPPNGAK